MLDRLYKSVITTCLVTFLLAGTNLCAQVSPFQEASANREGNFNILVAPTAGEHAMSAEQPRLITSDSMGTTTAQVPTNQDHEMLWSDSLQPCLDGDCYGQQPFGPEVIYEEKNWFLQQLELRSSKTHGRAMGPGGPLRGTSWLNRPYEITFESGAFVMTSSLDDNVRAANDYFAALQLGWDFDHYWGTQVRVGWTTPELVNTTLNEGSSSDNLLITDISALYYPWGDSKLRPYYRFGFGLTQLEYSNDSGNRVDQTMFTIPFGVGLKYQTRRWAALRLEIMDNLAIAQNETSTLNNLTITGGFEWRFGGRPSSYWAWASKGGAW